MEHLHVKAISGRNKKPSTFTIVPQNNVFLQIQGLNIKYSHQDYQKALPYPELRHLMHFA